MPYSVCTFWKRKIGDREGGKGMDLENRISYELPDWDCIKYNRHVSKHSHYLVCQKNKINSNPNWYFVFASLIAM